MHYVDEGTGPPILFCHGNHLRLDGFIMMGHDWGGPIGMAVATVRAERVRGVILGDTWLWPADLRMAATLGANRPCLVWGRQDLAFRPAHLLPRMRAAFADSVEVVLPHARHYIQEDAPEEIARAITMRFG